MQILPCGKSATKLPRWSPCTRNGEEMYIIRPWEVAPVSCSLPQNTTEGTFRDSVTQGLATLDNCTVLSLTQTRRQRGRWNLRPRENSEAISTLRWGKWGKEIPQPLLLLPPYGGTPHRTNPDSKGAYQRNPHRSPYQGTGQGGEEKTRLTLGRPTEEKQYLGPCETQSSPLMIPARTLINPIPIMLRGNKSKEN